MVKQRLKKYSHLFKVFKNLGLREVGGDRQVYHYNPVQQKSLIE